MRSLFIGDVHGCLTELKEIIKMFAPQIGDKIYQTGDLINKGPDSPGALDFACEHGIICVQGNHEAKLLKILDTPKELRTEKELNLLRSVKEPERLAKVVANWALWIDTGEELLIHAGLEPGKTKLEDMDKRHILSIREYEGKPWYEQTAYPNRTIIFGHWAMNGLVDLPHAKGLDTGCVYGKLLTAYCPQENRYYHVPAKKEYTSGKGMYSV